MFLRSNQGGKQVSQEAGCTVPATLGAQGCGWSPVVAPMQGANQEGGSVTLTSGDVVPPAATLGPPWCSIHVERKFPLPPPPSPGLLRCCQTGGVPGRVLHGQAALLSFLGHWFSFPFLLFVSLKIWLTTVYHLIGPSLYHICMYKEVCTSLHSGALLELSQ